MSDQRESEVRSLGSRTLAALDRLGIEPTPEAYKVWFSFLSDGNPDLTREMRGALDKGEQLDDARCRDLFDRYFGNVREERQLQRAGLRLGELAHQLIQEVGGISEGTARYGTVLSRARDDVAGTASRQEVDNVMARARLAGAEIVKPPQETFYGGYAGYFRDPDGHVWEAVWNPAAIPEDD